MKALIEFMANSNLSQAELARRVGVTQPMIYQIIKGLRPVPEKICVSIERATGGKVTRQDLRPNDWADIWPELVEQDHA